MALYEKTDEFSAGSLGFVGSYEELGVDIGPAHADRVLFFLVAAKIGHTGAPVGSGAVTANGNPCTKLVEHFSHASDMDLSIWCIPFPTGTTADIVVGGGTDYFMQAVAVEVFASTELDGTLADSDETPPVFSGDPYTLPSINVPIGGMAAVMAFDALPNLTFNGDFANSTDLSPNPIFTTFGISTTAGASSGTVTGQAFGGQYILLASFSPRSGGGGITVNLGLASETDTATAVGRSKSRAVGQASEANTAFPVARIKARAIGQASEADTAAAMVRSKLRSLGLASEIDTAFGLGLAKSLAIGLAQETDQAFSLGTSIVIALGLAQETDTGFAVTRLKQFGVGQAQEIDAAFALTAARKYALGLAQEISAAFPIAHLKARQLGIAIENDTAFPVTVVGGFVLVLQPIPLRTLIGPPQVRSLISEPKAALIGPEQIRRLP